MTPLVPPSRALAPASHLSHTLRGYLIWQARRRRRRQEAFAEGAEIEAVEYVCTLCTFINTTDSPECVMCGTLTLIQVVVQLL